MKDLLKNSSKILNNQEKLLKLKVVFMKNSYTQIIKQSASIE